MRFGAASKGLGHQHSLSSGWPPEIILPELPSQGESSEGEEMLRKLPRLLPSLWLALLAPLALFAQGWQHIGSVQKVEKLPDGVELTAGKAKVRVTAFREGVFRVRVAPSGAFPKDFSWAVIEAPEPPAIKIDDAKDEIRVTS